MKTIFTCLSLFLISFFTFAQDNGPGGVGDDSTNRFWFIADQIDQTNGSAVTTWQNIGGNTLDAAASLTNDPILNTNSINGQSALQFGTNAGLQIAKNSDLDNGEPYASRTFSVAIKTGTDILARQIIYEEGAGTRGLNMFIFNGELYYGAWNRADDDGGGPGDAAPWGFSSFQTTVTANTEYIITYVFNGNNTSTGTVECYLNGNLVGTIGGVGFLYNHNEAAIGNTGSDNSTFAETGSEVVGDFPFDGEIAEFIMYNFNINDSERISVENYLSSKYDINPLTNDIYTQDTTPNGDFDFNLVSINRQSATDENVSTNQGTGLISLNTSATLSDGHFFSVGSDLKDQTALGAITCTPSNQDVARLQATWRVDKTGAFTPDIIFDLINSSANVLSPTDISILIDDNAAFSSPSISNASSVTATTATFSGLTINAGDYITFELAINKAITQTPAGLNLEEELRFYFEANTINQANGTDVTTWANNGVNINDANTQTNSPSLSTEFANGQSFIEFDSGNNESLEIANNTDINVGGPYSQRTYSVVFRTGTNINTRQVIYEEGGGTRGLVIYIFNGELYFGAYNEANDGAGSPWTFRSVKTAIAAETTYVMTNVFFGTPGNTGTLQTYLDGSFLSSASGVGLLYDHGANISIGQNGDGNIMESGNVGAGNYFNGQIGELLIYNNVLDNNKITILNNYLAAKYGVTPTGNDIYAYDTNAEGDFDFNLLGVRENGASRIDNTTFSTGIIKFSNPSALNLSDALVAASDVQDQTNLDGSTADCSSIGADGLRLEATWRVDVQGSPGNIDIELDYNKIQIDVNDASELDLLISNDPTFPSGSTTRISPTSFCSTAQYLGVSFTDGEYFTFERTGIAPVTWDGASWANGSGVLNEPTVDDQFKKIVVSGSSGVLNQDAACSCLITEPVGQLDTNGFNLNVKKDIINDGSFDISSAELSFTGTANQFINGNGFTAQDVVLDNQNELTLSFNLGEQLQISNILNVADGILNTNSALLLLSNSTDTAQIDQLLGASDIIGDVTVERYAQARRAFRLVSSSLTTTTSIQDNWQEGATSYTVNPNAGFGTHITGNNTSQTDNSLNDGLDWTPTGDPSLFTFDNTAQVWTAFTNTKDNTLNEGDPYRLFVRGDRGIDVTSNFATPTPTVLRTTGTINKGGRTFTNINPTAGIASFVGNPFQAMVDMESVINNSTNLQQFFFVWDPTLGGTPIVGQQGGRGAFVTVDAANNTATGGSAMRKYVQPYQAIFVLSNGGPGNVVFDETDKSVVQSQVAVFSTELSAQYLKFKLFDAISFANNDTADDGLSLYFSAKSSNNIDEFDATKFGNIDENLATWSGNHLLSIENRALPKKEDVLQIYTTQYRSSDYVFEIEVGSFPDNDVYLVDNYTGEQILLEENNINIYGYSVDSNIDESIAWNRFTVEFDIVTLGTSDQEFENSIRVYPNPTSDILNIDISQNIDINDATLELYDVNGRLVIKQNTENGFVKNKPQLNVSQLSNGVYFLKVKTESKEFNQKVIIK